MPNNEPLSLSTLYQFNNFEKRGIKDLGFTEKRFELIRRFFDFVLEENIQKPSILIAGTKGKGSTSNFLRILLQKQSINIGLFTSPHLLRINERISINNNPISNEDFDRYFNYIHSRYLHFNKIYSDFKPSTFEFLTIMAKLYFQDSNTDIDIFEVGLGGRFDAVNCLDPEDRISAITSISLDHMSILGNTYHKIFMEKLAIARKEKPLFLGYQKYIDINDYREQLKEFQVWTYNNNFYFNENENLINFHYDYNKSISLKKDKYFPLYNKYNLSQAFEIAFYLLKEKIKDFKYHLNEFYIPCRFEIFKSSNRTIILDGAHNKDSMEYLLSEIQRIFPNMKKTLIFSCLKDKDLDGMLDIIQEYPPYLTVFQNMGSERAIDFINVNLKKKYSFRHIINSDPNNIYNNLPQGEDNLIIICGSFYLCALYKNLL